MSIEYSPLCAYDLRAYLAYCSAKSPNVANLFGQIGVLADVDGDNSSSGIDAHSNVLLVSAKTIDVSYAELEESCRGCVECSRTTSLVRATRVGGTVAWSGAVGGGFTLHGFCGRAHLVSRGPFAAICAVDSDNLDGQVVGMVGEQRIGGDNAGCVVRCSVGGRLGGDGVVADATEHSGGVSGHCDSTVDSGVCSDIFVDPSADLSTGVSRDCVGHCAIGGCGRCVVGDGVRGQCGEAAVKYVLPQRRGPNGGLSVGRGVNYEKNSRGRARRRLAKRDRDSSSGFSGSRVFAHCTESQRDELRDTRAVRLISENKLQTVRAQRDLETLQARGQAQRQKGTESPLGCETEDVTMWKGKKKTELRLGLERRWAAENELKAAEARRKLELLCAQDVTQLKKRQETKLMRDTELNKVQVEQAFNKLAGAGNVPGFAQTVVSSEGTPQLVSGSISPNSSVSMAEIHAMQKENLEFRRRQDLLLRKNPELHAEIVAAKLPSEQTGWSLDESGRPKGNIGDGVGGMIGPDGRLHDYDDYADY